MTEVRRQDEAGNFDQDEVIDMAKTCEDIHALRQRVAQHYGKKPVQFTMFLEAPGS